jgi:hypothetical protein
MVLGVNDSEIEARSEHLPLMDSVFSFEQLFSGNSFGSSISVHQALVVSSPRHCHYVHNPNICCLAPERKIPFCGGKSFQENQI